MIIIKIGRLDFSEIDFKAIYINNRVVAAVAIEQFFQCRNDLVPIQRCYAGVASVKTVSLLCTVGRSVCLRILCNIIIYFIHRRHCATRSSFSSETMVFRFPVFCQRCQVDSFVFHFAQCLLQLFLFMRGNAHRHPQQQLIQAKPGGVAQQQSSVHLQRLFSRQAYFLVRSRPAYCTYAYSAGLLP